MEQAIRDAFGTQGQSVVEQTMYAMGPDQAREAVRTQGRILVNAMNRAEAPDATPEAKAYADASHAIYAVFCMTYVELFT